MTKICLKSQQQSIEHKRRRKEISMFHQQNLQCANDHQLKRQQTLYVASLASWFDIHDMKAEVRCHLLF